MLSEWNAACAHEDPTVVVPWSDPASGARFFDLRTEPYDIAEIPEAELHPALGRALRSLNAARSPVITAKCDAWALVPDTDDTLLESLRMELMLAEEDAACGFSSYIDLIWRERSLFASSHQQQDRLDRITRRVQKLSHPEAALDCTLRPAFLDLNSPLEGFAVSLYVTAIGADADLAKRRWELALEDVVSVLRSKEFEPMRGSATIDAAANSQSSIRD
jgi:hypothetical protein